MTEVIEQVADAIDAARYAHPTHPRERERPFSQADSGDREYAARLARAAVEEFVKFVDEFSWVLPLYNNRATNAATDDAAEAVKGQMVATLRAALSAGQRE